MVVYRILCIYHDLTICPKNCKGAKIKMLLNGVNTKAQNGASREQWRVIRLDLFDVVYKIIVTLPHCCLILTYLSRVVRLTL